MGTHPDILELRARYEAAGANPAAQLTDGLTLLSGLYLALSPWVVGFQNRPIAVNNLVTGLAIAVLALCYSSAFGRTHGISWIAPVLGLWTIIAPWVIRGGTNTAGTIANNVVTGAILLALGLTTVRFSMIGRGRPAGFHAPPEH
ncbi:MULTISPECIES: SPW repeat protein [Sphaerimonospora]|nr:SPW repeat protein [Sphaerimonospora thailandensis]